MVACVLDVPDNALVIVRVRAACDQEAIVHRCGVPEVATHEKCDENDSYQDEDGTPVPTQPGILLEQGLETTYLWLLYLLGTTLWPPIICIHR